MPYLGPITCNSLGYVGAASKYVIAIGPLEPSCEGSMAGGFSLIADFMGDQWFGTSDGMDATIRFVGVSSGTPVWNVTFSQTDCGGGSQQISSSCPPGPFTFTFAPLNSLCCPTNPNGDCVVGGGFERWENTTGTHYIVSEYCKIDFLLL
jgi:hypothetical protein